MRQNQVKSRGWLMPLSMPLPRPENLNRKPIVRGIWTMPKSMKAFPDTFTVTDRKFFHVADPSAQALLGASSARVMSFGGKPLYEQYWNVTEPLCAAVPVALSTWAPRTSSLQGVGPHAAKVATGCKLVL
jgi:hypothetical protein